MITCVLRYANLDTLFSKLAQMGIDVKPATDAEGKPVPIETRVGGVCTPELIAKNLDHVITMVLSEEEASKIPEVTSPEFLCDWRSDEYVEDEEGKASSLPWPEYEITTPEGWPTETVSGDGLIKTPCVYTQGAERIY